MMMRSDSAPTTRSTPVTIDSLRQSQRQLWKHRCTACGCDARELASAPDLQVRVRELEQQVRELERRLAAATSS